MKEHTSFAGHGRKSGNILNRSGLVVAVHDRDEAGVVGDQLSEFGRRSEPFAVDREQVQTETFMMVQMFHRFYHSVMFGGADDEMRFLFAILISRAEYGDVVRLGTARRKVQLGRFTVDDTCYCLARLLQRHFGVASEHMNGTGVAVTFIQIRKHCFHHSRIYRRRGIMIEVNWFHTHSVISHAWSTLNKYAPTVALIDPQRRCLHLCQKAYNILKCQR